MYDALFAVVMILRSSIRDLSKWVFYVLTRVIRWELILERYTFQRNRRSRNRRSIIKWDINVFSLFFFSFLFFFFLVRCCFSILHTRKYTYVCGRNKCIHMQCNAYAMRVVYIDILLSYQMSNCNLLVLIYWTLLKSHTCSCSFHWLYIDNEKYRKRVMKSVGRITVASKINLHRSGDERSLFVRERDRTYSWATARREMRCWYKTKRKQVPKIDSFSSQTLSVNSALLTRFHLECFERIISRKGDR
jgi:hypothetical protein